MMWPFYWLMSKLFDTDKSVPVLGVIGIIGTMLVVFKLLGTKAFGWTVALIPFFIIGTAIALGGIWLWYIHYRIHRDPKDKYREIVHEKAEKRKRTKPEKRRRL